MRWDSTLVEPAWIAPRIDAPEHFGGQRAPMTASMLIDSVADTTSHRDRDDLDVSITRLLLHFLDAETVTIYRLIDDGSVKRVLRRVVAERSSRDVSVQGHVDPGGLPALSDVPAWSDCVAKRSATQYTTFGGNTCRVFPMENEREVVGLLAVDARHDLRERDINLVLGILRIVRNHLALLDYGERDTLTSLNNRKTFGSSFEKLRARPSATNTTNEPSWLGVVDIDCFKAINDTYGHLFGDEVLLLVARLMMQSFRGADQLFRFGGEEFVIVLDHATVAGAAIAFERFRAAVEGFSFPQVGRVTVSLGYTQIHPDDAPSTCVERADSALYYAKNHGRNKVCSHEALISSGELAAKASTADIELF
jgi:diguanylate cyclase (GGDEF)-like protein